MCGIVGIYKHNIDKITNNELDYFTDSLSHRGPDGRGIFINPDRNVGLGHRRLAILDISEPDIHKRREKLENLLAEFAIEHLRQTPALALSGGERRRVEIARSIAADPRFLLLDEPFAGVDPISVGDIRQLVAELKKRSIGVLITDHNVRETLHLVDRAYILHDGQVLMSGTAQEVIEDENVKRVYLGDSFSMGG